MEDLFAPHASVTSTELSVETAARATKDDALSNAVSVASGAVSVLQSAYLSLVNRVSVNSAAGGGGSVTSADLDLVSAAAAAAEVHAAAASAAASVASLAATSADAHAAAASAAASIASLAATSADGHAETASLAATSADAHAAAASAAATSIDSRVRRATNTAAQASITVSTGITVSGVSIALVNGVQYYFEFLIPFTAALPSGIVVGVVGPAMTAFSARYEIPGAAAAAGVAPAANAITPFQAHVAAIGTKVSTTSITLSGTTLVAYAWGIALPSASGSLKFVIGPNVSGGANSGVVVRRGATLVVKTVP